MTSDSPKELRYIWYTIILVFIVQIAGLGYLRKKFDDNIVILQSSENAMNMKVESIEGMLLRMTAAERKSKETSPAVVKVKSAPEGTTKESAKEDTDKPATEN
jgi:hypothetical protein